MVKIVGAPPDPGLTVGGLKVAVAPAGRPLADMVTTLLNAPPSGGTVTGMVTKPPSATETGVAGATTVYAASIVSVTADELEPSKMALPEKTAVTLSLPSERVEMLNVAT